MTDKQRSNTVEREQQLRIARRRAGAKFGFYVHLAIFVAVNTLLYVVNLRAAPEIHWHLFPLGGWVIGLAIHGLAVFFSGSGLRERMVEAEMRKLEAKRSPGTN